MYFTSVAKMLLITLMVIWALTDVAIAIDATVSPTDPVAHNGRDLTINCTLKGQLDSRTASDIVWSACLYAAVSSCGNVTASHWVQVVNNQTSLLHLQNLVMPQEGQREGTTYSCHFDATITVRDIWYSATKVYVGIPPYPVENLQCRSWDKVNFTCSWSSGGYAGLRLKKTYFQYRERGSNDWITPDTRKELFQYTGRAEMYQMEMRVTQENPLGNSTPSTIYFSAATQTVPHPPGGMALTFLQEGDDDISIQLRWQLPDGWSESPSLLQYVINYKDSKRDKFSTVGSITGPSRSFTVHSVEPYTNYTARVKCKLAGANSWSEWSPLVTDLSPEAAPSGDVLGLMESILNTNQDPYKRDVLLTWQPPSQDNRHGVIRGYHLFVSQSLLPQPIIVTQSSYELTDLDKFQRYDVRVAAYTKEDTVGPFKDIIIQDLTTVPAKVENFEAISKMSDRIHISWDEPSDPHGVVLKYSVKWGVWQNPNYRSIDLPASTMEYTLTGLRPYTQYEITIRVHNKEGGSPLATEKPTTRYTRPTQPLSMKYKKHSPTEIQLYWVEPESINGPFLSYEIHYRPSSSSSQYSISKSVSVPHTPVTINCSAYEEAVPFTFQVFASTGFNESDKLLGSPAVLEKEMCGADYAITSIIIGVLISAFSILCLVFCLYTVRRSPLMKPSPDPYFIDGILEPSGDKFKFNSRLATRRQEKEDYDALKPCESVRELIGHVSQVESTKGSMSSSTGSSSDQGFHEMQSDVTIAHYSNMGLEAVPNQAYPRCSSGYGHSILSQSEQDIHQNQRMLSMNEEDTEDVFECPEDIDDGPSGECVNSYKTSRSTDVTPQASPESVRVSLGSRASVQYTSRQDSPVITRESRSQSASPPNQDNRFSSGSESGSLNYLQLGANFPQPVPAPQKEARGNSPLGRHDPGDESDTSYSQMAMQETMPTQMPDEQEPAYQSVWPSEISPEKQDPNVIGLDPAWMDGFHTDLGFNNNSKEFPDIHAPSGLFRPPREIIVATAFSPQTPTSSTDPRNVNQSLPRLSSAGSEDYIDIVGGSSSPRANAPAHTLSPTLSSPAVQSPCSRGDISCQDYVMQCELPPASPPEKSVL